MKFLTTVVSLLLAAGALAQPPPKKTLPWVKKLTKDVGDATLAWAAAVTSVRTGKNVSEAAATTAGFYAPYAVFFATVSANLRTTPQEVRDYFDFFAGLPDLQVLKYKPYITILDHKTARNDGYIQLSYQCVKGSNAKVRVVNARFSFHYRLINKKWMIVEHHNSAVPAQPAGVKSATTFTTADYPGGWVFEPIPDVCAAPAVAPAVAEAEAADEVPEGGESR